MCIRDRFSTTAGGGVVTVVMNGKKEMKSLTIKPEIVNADDIEMLQDLIMAATNEALRTIEEKTAQEIDVYKRQVVVMDVRSGDLLAVVSLPDFDPNNLSKSMAQKDSPFFNRAFHGEYNVGSTFKLVTASTALEQGISRFRTFDCTGAVEVEDVTFHCHKLSGHGVLDMQGAMEWSCNPYFITLGQMAGGENILKKAQAIGFGSPSQLAPGIATASGSLPALEAMESPAEAVSYTHLDVYKRQCVGCFTGEYPIETPYEKPVCKYDLKI